MNDLAGRKVLLVILDGFGHSDESDNNAIALAKKPTFDELYKKCPHSLLQTSGPAVGLPKGQMGNSEVGHLNIGGGRIIPQELTRIVNFAKENGFESLPDVDRVLKSSGEVHLMGLLSDGGVHSDQEHLFLLLESAARVRSGRPVYIHVITDGRDTPPQSALQYLTDLEKAIAKTKAGIIATVGGRFYMMDRDKRWERTQIAYEALTNDKPSPEFGITKAKNARMAIEEAYAAKETDEFIKPRQISGGRRIHPEDSLICFNFRADRMRQICRALGIDSFNEFPTSVNLKAQNLITFTGYEDSFPFPILFRPQRYTHLLGELVAEHGDAQLRIAETEKYAHVTYFFNGGEEKPYPKEDRVLIQSPKDVPTYDLKPEMSALQVTDALIQKIDEKDYRLIVLNFANSDMVGHSGNLEAAIKAVETLDRCMRRILETTAAKGYDVLITADHGNAECMVDPETKKPHTAHTTNPVPFIWIPSPQRDSKAKGVKLQNGILADIAPTVLGLLGWSQPREMTGRNLIGS